MPLSLLDLFAPPAPVRCLALTGAGGKTTLLAVLAQNLAAGGRSVIVTTTTHIWPPNDAALSPLRGDGPLFVAGRSLSGIAAETAALFRARPGRVVVAARDADPATGKLRGLAPACLCALQARLDKAAATSSLIPPPVLLVEADGAARYPLKAHTGHEPALPPCADAVIAVMGLDALGRPLAEAVHRPERAAALLGVDKAQTVTPAMAATLLLHPAGPFRHAPARRVVLLNKADLPGGEAAAVAVARAVAALDPVLPCHAGSLTAGESRPLFPLPSR